MRRCESHLTFLKNRANVAASILQSPDILRNAFESSQNAEGSAQEELDKYLESIEARFCLYVQKCA